MSGGRPLRTAAVIHHGFAYGGSERVVVEQVRALSGAGAVVDVWAPNEDGPDDLVPALRALGPGVRDVGRLPSEKHVRDTLIARQYDVVVTCEVARAYRAALSLAHNPLRRRPPLVETVHERYDWNLRDEHGRKRRAVDAWMLTHDFRDRLAARMRVAPERMGIAHPLFPESLLAPTPNDLAEAAAFRARLGIAPGAVVLGYLGRVAENKGVHHLVPMVARMVRDGLDVHLVLAGRTMPPGSGFDGELSGLVARAQADEPRLVGRVHRPGALRSRHAVYPAFDVLPLCSRVEGLLPLTLVEAMSVGIPVVTTDVGGIREMLRDDADAAVVRKEPDDESPPSPDVLAAFEGRLRALATDAATRKRLGDAGRARVRALVAANDFRGDFLRVVELAMRARGRR